MKKIYFASDFHLGIDVKYTSRERELQLMEWLDIVSQDAEAIYLVGDLFDFWFEYHTVVPKGFLRFIGKLAELTDKGVQIKIFTGNHDVWMFDYFPKELNIPIIRNPITIEAYGKKLLVGHGDGLGPGDLGYKLLKKAFVNPICQWFFQKLHPNFGIWIATTWSNTSKKNQGPEEHNFLGKEKEWLATYCEGILKAEFFDYFIFGHRHLPLDIALSNGKSRYLNLGDWMNYNSYIVLDEAGIHTQFFKNPNGKFIQA
jgi:UDP-2,3-diacylglucosamine hydrolase